MSPPDYDIAILGAGPVGQTLALLLARLNRDPARIALLAGDGGASQPAPADDPRILAINHGSRVLLESLQAWPERAAAITHIHVSQRGRLGRAVIARDDFDDVPALGNTVSYADLHACLLERVAVSGVTLLSGPPAVVADQDAHAVRIAQGDATLRCAVAVRCDGAGGQDVRRDYGQHAILAHASATLARPGWAWERFTREGPLALLPHPQMRGDYSVVWCCEPSRAALLAQADDDDFSRALTAAFGDRLGRLRSAAPRQVYPLILKARHAQSQGRVATIGNASQTLHPVAGQGLNLGLRDTAQLAQALGPWLAAQNTGDGPASQTQPSDTRQNPAVLLANFARSRLPDRLLTVGITDFMPRAFTTGLAPVEHACGLALLGLDLCAPVRAPLARHFLQGLRH